MKSILLAVTGWFLFCGTQTAYSSAFAVPSLGAVVRNADTIVRGRFSADGTSIVFQVESSVKGKYRPLQTVRITGSGADIFFDLAHYATQLQGQQCFVLGMDHTDAISLPWNSFSVWPQGISQKWPVFEDIGTCTTFIAALVKYEHLEADPSILLTHLLSALRTNSSRPAALAYLDSNPRIFENNTSLERDVLSVVAAQISSSRIYDDWTAGCMLSLSPDMPQSITIPYFMEVAKKGGKQGALAQSAVEAALKIRGLLDPSVRDREDISATIAAGLPDLRTSDAKRNVHLFNTTNSDIAALAPLVLSEVFGEPRPSGKSASEEKAFWTGKISERQKEKGSP